MFSKHMVALAAFALTGTVAGVAAAKPPAEWGGFGQAFFGGALQSYGNFENEMAKPRVLGNDFSIGTLSPQYGGGGWMMIAGTLMVGGRGFGYSIPASDSQGANVTIAGGGGGFTLGYAAYNQDAYLIYPYFGLGGYALSIEVQNQLASQSIEFGSARVAPGEVDVFQTGFYAFEFGVGLQRLLFFGDGGFTVGAEAGLTVPVSAGTWSDEGDNDVSGLEDLGVSGGYLRITLGGGGFFFGDDPSVHRHESAKH